MTLEERASLPYDAMVAYTNVANTMAEKAGENGCMANEVRNMKIESVSISMEDHGCLTFYLSMTNGGVCVSLGGYCIGKGYLGAKPEDFIGSPSGIECLMRIMDTVGVEKWEDLRGKYVRMVDPGWGGTVTTIGNILQDKWFNVREFFEQKREGTD